MKRVLLLLSLIGMMLGAHANEEHEKYHPKETDDYITINDVTVVPGSNEEYELLISLEGSKIYTAYEMDIEFPAGLEVIVDEDGPYVTLWDGDGCIYPKTRKQITHTVTSSWGKIGANSLRLACIDLSAKEFVATKGILLSIYCKAGAYLKPGDVNLKVSNLHFITNEEIWVDGKQLNGQQYNCKDQTLMVHVANKSTASISVSAKNKFGTCVLPFDVDELPDGLHAYSVTERSADAKYAFLTEQKSIKAFVPYILYDENGFSGTFSGEVDESKYQEEVNEGILYGTMVPRSVKEGFILQNQGSGVKLYAMMGNQFLIPAGRCWVLPKIYNDPGVKSLDLSFDEETGIGATPADKPHSSQSAIYMLDGKRVQHPQAGHIYIMNGQKVFWLK